MSCACPASIYHLSASFPARAEAPFLPGLNLPFCQGSAFLPAWAQPPCLPGPSPSFCQGPAPFLPGLNLFPTRAQPLFLQGLNFPSCLSSLTLPAIYPVRLCQAFAEGNVPLIKIIRLSSLNPNPGAIKAYVSSPGHLRAALGREILS